MKKEYTNPTIEVIEVNNEDVIVTSSYDPENILNSSSDTWFS